MDSNLALINFDFGTKQLSGNLALYTRLLGRFASDYEHTSEKLAEFEQLNNLEEMQLLVHTIKGVSGNLGLDRLHQGAKSLDNSLKLGTIDAQLVSQLTLLMASTLSEINQHGQSTANNENTANRMVISKQYLIEELQKQRFISDEKLNEFIDGSGLPSAQQQSLKSAIDQLDYPAALEILEGH